MVEGWSAFYYPVPEAPGIMAVVGRHTCLYNNNDNDDDDDNNKIKTWTNSMDMPTMSSTAAFAHFACWTFAKTTKAMSSGRMMLRHFIWPKRLSCSFSIFCVRPHRPRSMRLVLATSILLLFANPEKKKQKISITTKQQQLDMNSPIFTNPAQK